MSFRPSNRSSQALHFCLTFGLASYYLSRYAASSLDRVSARLTPCAYREAVASGDATAIFATAYKLNSALWNTGHAAESPVILEPLIFLAKEEHAILDQTRLSNLCALGLNYCGENLRGVALLEKVYEDCVAARDKEIADIRREAEERQLRESVELIRPITLSLRTQIYFTANNLMVVYQDMGAFAQAMCWGERAIEEAEVMSNTTLH
jgi:hypothetical protein